MKKILSLILVVCIFLIPFKIFADTVYKSPPETMSTLGTSSRGRIVEWQTSNSSKEARLILLRDNTILRLFVITTSANSGGGAKFKVNGYTQSLTSNNNVEYNGVYYKYSSWVQNSNDYTSYDTVSAYELTYGVTEIDSSLNLVDLAHYAVYYTFGEGSENQTNNWGLLNIRFNTEISTHDAGENQDNILWTAWDTNGNYIGDKQIEIRAVPGYYEANDKPSLLQMQFINWVKNSNLSVQVYKGSIIPEHRSFTWNYIAGLFSSIKTWEGKFWSIFASDDYWYQYGWVYEARILDENDDPLSEWQEIVTGTASSPKDTEIIEMSDELTPELYNVIYNINVYNDYQENWQINNTTINMQPEETIDNDKPWWVVLLEGILSILDKLLDMLLKLFVPTEFFIPEFTTNSNQYMQNTGIFGQAVQFVNDTGTSLQLVQNADPVISIPAISWQNTTIIPAQSWNLNTLVNDYGLSELHNMVYLVTDGFIYIGLIIMIRRKVIEALKK